MASSYDIENAEENGKEEIEMADAKKQTQYQTAPLPDATKRTLRGPLAPVNNFLNAVEENTVSFVKEQESYVIGTFLLLLFCGYMVYFIIAVNKDFDRARDLVYVTCFGLFCILYWAVKKYCGRAIWKTILKPLHASLLSYWKFLKWLGILLFVGFTLFWIIYDTRKEPERLISLAGLFVYVLLGFLLSKKRDQVKWRPVLWGFALQFIFGLLILRTDAGFQFFDWLGDRVTIFLSFSSSGSKFVFGDLSQFGFTVLPVIVYFSSFTYLTYYLGIIQVVIKKIAWLLQVTMGTSPSESVNAAGNIFIGQTEAPLLIRPFLETMTESELHAVMTGGFATIAGSVLGAYISFGVSASHLLSASVMSAPAALAMSKLMYPEIEEPAIKSVDDITIERTDEQNIFEAMAVGASMSIGLVANITVMLIAFLAMLALTNGVLHWLGCMVDECDFSFEYMCSYVFMPFAYIMGVEWDDSFEVAKLLGVKTFLNEFIAYKRFAQIITNRVQNLDGDKISIRSEVITTYALCGFANFGSMGVQLGGLSVLAPSKRTILSRIVLRALIAGTFACFMTACIAGMLYDKGRYDTTITPAPNVTLQYTTTAATTIT